MRSLNLFYCLYLRYKKWVFELRRSLMKLVPIIFFLILKTLFISIIVVDFEAFKISEAKEHHEQNYNSFDFLVHPPSTFINNSPFSVISKRNLYFLFLNPI